MNTDFPSHLAKQLADNPSLFGATKEEMLAELLTAYVNGTLPSEDAAEVEALIKSNARAKTIHENILAANCFLASDEGKAWLKSPIQGISEKPNIAERLAEAVELVADKIKRYCDLRFHVPQFAGGGNLAGDALEHGDKPRAIVLAREFSESELKRIPWAGPKVKLSKTVDTKTGAAVYLAFVTSIIPDAPKTGVLRIVLIAPDGQAAEARLDPNHPKRMFESVKLPANSNELRFALFIE